jgi:hypothetical protein
MSARSTQVFLHNETGFLLNRVQEDIPHGEWGDDGGQEPPPEVQPQTVAQMGSDSSGVATGTEASVRYRIEDGKNSSVYVHWDNPFDGVNSYHEFTDVDFEVFHTGGDGDNAVIDVFLRPSARHGAGDFLPSKNGYHFSNKWGDVPYQLPPLRGSLPDLKYGNAKNGLCGGMVYSVRDYFEAQKPVPPDTVPPAGEQNPLFIYIVDRLFDSFDIDDVTLYLKLMDPAYPDTDENILNPVGLANGRAFVMAKIEFPLIRQDILAGHTSPMGLVMIKSLWPGDIGENHQVLAYAYQARGQDIDLWVYDPNKPDKDDVKISFNITSTADPIVVTHNVEDNKAPIYCFFRTNYSVRNAPDFWLPRSSQNAVVRTPDHLDVFWAGNDGAVWTTWWDAHTDSAHWNPIFSISPPVSTEPGTPIAGVARNTQHLDVFWVGYDGAIWTTWWDLIVDSGQWHPPFRLTAPAAAQIGSAITTIARTTDHLDIFWVGQDGGIWSTWWDANIDSAQWHPPFRITGPVAARLGSPVNAVSRNNTRLDLFWVALDGALTTTWWDQNLDGGQWQPPSRLTGSGAVQLGAPICSVSRTQDHLDVFWTGQDGAVWSTWWDANVDSAQWHAPFPLSAPAGLQPGSPIVADCRNLTHLDIFWVGNDATIWTTWWDQSVDGAQWHPPFQLPGPASVQLATSSLTAISRIEPQLDLFWVGQDGGIWNMGWDRASGIWQNPSAITGSVVAQAVRGRRPVENTSQCVSRHPDHVDCYWIGPDGAIATTWWDAHIDSAIWHAPFPLTPPGAARVDSPLVAISRSVDHLDLFWIGPDGAIATTWWDAHIDSANWHPAFPLTPPGAARVDSPLSAVSRVLDHLDLFWIGPDGAIGTTWWDAHIDGGSWHPAFPLTSANAARGNSPLVAISRIPEHLDLFWLGRDGAIGTTWWDQNIDQGQWHVPFALTAPGAAGSVSPLTAVSRIPEHLDVFWLGPDGAIGTTWWDQNINQGQWNNPFPVTPPGAARSNSPLVACSRAPEHLDLFWFGPDGAIGTTWWDQNFDQASWHTPFPLTPPGASGPASFLSSVTRVNDHLDLFWRGADGAIGTTWWDAHIDNANWHAPFAITPPDAAR